MPTTPRSKISSRRCSLTILQLHGHETVARLADIKQRFGLAGDEGASGRDARPIFRRCPATPRRADRILFDARAPKGATRPGGLGAVFDWHVLENLDLNLPFMVSGGLTVRQCRGGAFASPRAGGVDVSSGVERAPGVRIPR